MEKLASLSISLIIACTLTAQTTADKTNDAWLISRMAEKFHVQARPLDDSLSAALFSEVLHYLDEDRIFLTAEDIKGLSVYRYMLDDEIRKGQDDFLQVLTPIFKQRLVQADTIIDHIAASAFDVHRRGTYSMAEDTAYAANLAGIHSKLYKLLCFSVASSMAEYVVSSGRPLTRALIDSLEPRLRKKAALSAKRSIKRILQSPVGIDHAIVITFCQALAACYDPHTEYFTADEKADFEGVLGNKTLSYGLALSEDEDGNPKIGRLAPGGPAFNSGALHEGDKILSIQIDGKDAIDVSNATLQETGEILATEGGSKVTLKVKRPDGTTGTVSLQKEKLNSNEEDDKVKGFILKGSRNIGYISLPAFYSDWEDNKGINGCANDVAKEIIKLKKENIGGLILDLRYNGGGSMQEAVELAGIFIDAGPVGQVKSKEPKVITLKDVNRGTIYDGPLLLLVNGSSASASEMVAGTLQDYNRALIVGAPTYGKATAQVVLPLDTTLDLNTYNGAGQAAAYIKLTISRLYRITGKTAQFSGVQPDIVLPEPAGAVQQRESDEKFALPPTTIEANKYYKPLAALPLGRLQDLAKQTMEADSFFRAAASRKKPSVNGGRKDVSLSVDDLVLEMKDVPAGSSGAAGAAQTAGAKGQGKNTLFTVADHGAQQVGEERKKNVLYDPYIQVAYTLVVAMTP